MIWQNFQFQMILNDLIFIIIANEECKSQITACIGWQIYMFYEYQTISNKLCKKSND